MRILFHRFQLKPKVELNRLSSASFREGVFLKSEGSGGTGYTEYFPHPELGDQDINDFLETFKVQRHETQKKALYLLAPKWSRIESGKAFLNHQLFREGDPIGSGTIKYKIKNENDFLQSLPSGVKSIRLDANGLFNQNSWKVFEQKALTSHLKLIDYIEDPIADGKWQDIQIPRAVDFINGSPNEVKIYKPYREFYPEGNKRIIFSGNMGHGLSNYQSYLELLERGNLVDHHGLLTPDLYDNLPEIFSGNFQDGFKPELNSLREYFKQLESLTWTPL
jgi:hypothetical protein